ncbi:hypothetical protein BX616_004038, partial [Lobosporangium transversale]
IKTSTFHLVLTNLGEKLSDAEVDELMKGVEVDKFGKVNYEGSNVIDFDTFLKVLMRPNGFKPAGTYQEFINGFKVFDKEGNGHISQGELRYGKMYV